mmetsp:Transcript_35646/g.52240  ORF Transcript_35646/g.52240 Transcript_35646/m.52240 type:complete len:180 (-) Transcript_35646:548-1087(-)
MRDKESTNKSSNISIKDFSSEEEEEEEEDVPEEGTTTTRRDTLSNTRIEASKAYLVRGPVSKKLGPYVYHHRKKLGVLCFLSFIIIVGLSAVLIWLKLSNAKLLSLQIRAENGGEDETEVLNTTFTLTNELLLDNSTHLSSQPTISPTARPTLGPIPYSTLQYAFEDTPNHLRHHKPAV